MQCVGYTRVNVSLDYRGTVAYRAVSICFIMGQPTVRLRRQKAYSDVSRYCRMGSMRS